MKDSKLDLVVAGTERAVLMVESEADQLSEEVMLGAVMFGYEKNAGCYRKPSTNSLKPVNRCGIGLLQNAISSLLRSSIRSSANRIHEAYEHRSKQDRNECLRAIYDDVNEKVNAAVEVGELAEIGENEVANILFEMEAAHVRGKILSGEPRIDGRDTRTVRPIEIPYRCSSARSRLCALHRGETQALVVTTLGTKQDEQIVDGLTGEQRDASCFTTTCLRLLPVKPAASALRRDAKSVMCRLAKRALTAVLPNEEDFQYTKCGFRNLRIQRFFPLWRASAAAACPCWMPACL